MLYGVIGIGSNSTRLLIGRPESGKILPVLRLREGTRLFAGLSQGMLSPESMQSTAHAVYRFAMIAKEYSVDELRIIATSAARDAANGAALCDLVEAMSGYRPQILTGQEEAELSFVGCAGSHFAGMIDLGGGSTEIATGGEGRPFFGVSIQLGAGRLLQEMPSLTGAHFGAALQLCIRRVQKTFPTSQPLPLFWYGIGGTITCLAAMDMELAVYDREAVNDHILTRNAVEAWAHRLAGMHFKERTEIPGIQPARADIITHGAVALLGILHGLQIDEVVVRNTSNLDGMLQRLANER